MGHGNEGEQPLVDLELLSHFESVEEERTEREQDLDIDAFRARLGDDESFAHELAQWGESEGYDPKAKQLIPVIREVA